MTAPVQLPAHSGSRARRIRRSGIVGAAVFAALVVWLIAGPVLGQELRITEEGGSGERVLEIGLFPVIVVSLFAALAGWALLAVLERFTRRALPVWIVATFAVLAVSFLPLTGSGMTGGTRTSLAVMHLAVAAVLIPGLTGSGRRAKP
ncbi:DUF6069 family protein [Streptomyces sp. CA-250714]|uniref:DUF6069 family protein n=1 Tax=Streptomyces sp. CA-250714 TaxID=3240060 RepID=UPI003D8A3094